MESKIDFDRHKFAIASNNRIHGNIFRFNDLADLRVTDDFYMISAFSFGRKVNTLHTNPDYKASKYDGEFLAKTNESKEMEIPEGATHRKIEWKDVNDYYKLEGGREFYFWHDASGKFMPSANCDDWHQSKLEKLESKEMIYTQVMKDKGELVWPEMKFSTCAGEYVAIMTNEKSVVFKDEEGHLVAINIESAMPIDQRTDEEKAIDDMNDVYKAHIRDVQDYIDILFVDIKAGKIHGVTFTGDK